MKMDNSKSQSKETTPHPKPDGYASLNSASKHSQTHSSKRGGTRSLPDYRTKDPANFSPPPPYETKEEAAQTVAKIVNDGKSILEPVAVHDYNPQSRSWTSTKTITQRHPIPLYEGPRRDTFRAFNCNVSKSWLEHPKILGLRKNPGDRTEDIARRDVEKVYSGNARVGEVQVVEFLENVLKGQFGTLEEFHEGHYTDFVDSLRA